LFFRTFDSFGSHIVPCPIEDAKRIIKVVVDGDYEATKATVTGVVRPDY
jgi:4-hydroxy-tetrahydrodipicolinate synthase